MPLPGLILGAFGALDSGAKILADKEKGAPVQQSDIAGVIGGVAAMIGAGAVLITAGGAFVPLVVTVGAIATVVSVAASAYQLVAGAAGWKIDVDRNVTPLPVIDAQQQLHAGRHATGRVVKADHAERSGYDKNAPAEPG